MNLPADIINQSLDAMGSERTIGDLAEGSREAQVMLRAYGQCLRQLLRSANWNFARRTAPLTLLADATGQTPTAGTVVPAPWVYEYSYPIDCLKARFVPYQTAPLLAPPAGNIAIPTTVPLMPGLGLPQQVGRSLRPARFLIATDFNYPEPQGQGVTMEQGVSPQGRTVVLTDVPSAQLVYTSLVLYPQLWDALFRAAFVAYLASETVLAILKDKKLAMAIREQQIAIAKQKLLEARAVEGNESTSSADVRVDWIDRRSRGGYEREWSGGGGFWGGNDACAFADGSVF